MRAVLVEHFGAPEVLTLRETAPPEPGDGQVIIEVAAASVLYLDTQIRLGRGGEHFGVTPPYVPGNGVAGTVVGLGAGVDAAWLGRRVVADTLGGGYVELAVANAAELVAVPDGLSLPDAGALLHDGRTALALLEKAGVRAGERVLVLPAAGGAGSVLVQLAKAAGAHVIGAARGKLKLDLVRELGADAVLDYDTEDWAAGAGAVDVAFDGVGGAIGLAAFGAVADGGRYSHYGAPATAEHGVAVPVVIDPAEARRRDIRAWGMEQLGEFRADRVRRAEQVLAEAEAGRIRPLIGQTYPLARAGEAHQAIESRRSVGKSLLVN